MSSALVDFAVQARVSVATPRFGLGTAQSAPLRGKFTPDTALDHLLAGTGYTYQRLDAATYRIVARSEPAAPAVTPTPERDVIVTAARRPQSLGRIAASATVLNRDRLRASGARDASDLPSEAAGLTLTNVGPGRNKLIVRSLSDGAFSGNAQSTVGIYLDDSRLTYGAPDPDLMLADVEAVEIVRGPQGTTYGAGSIAGVYQIVTRQPELDRRTAAVRLSAESSAAGEIGSDVEAMFNQPIKAGALGVRLVAYREETPGWLNNEGLNQNNTNRTIRVGARASVLARFGGTWSLTARGVTQRIESGDSQYAETGRRLTRRTKVLESNTTDFSLLSATVRGSVESGELTSTTTLLHH